MTEPAHVRVDGYNYRSGFSPFDESAPTKYGFRFVCEAPAVWSLGCIQEDEFPAKAQKEIQANEEIW